MRPATVIPVICVLGVAACAHATAPAHQAPTPVPGHQDTSHTAAGTGRQQAPDATAPKPYNQVITAGAKTDSGVFTIHRTDEKLFYEIPKAMFGREFLLVADQRGTIRGVRYAGEEISNRIVVWERMGNKVFLRIVSYAMRADSTQPVARAVRLSNIAPIIMSFDVASWHLPDSNAVIEVTKLFTTDVAELNLRQSGVRVRRMDPARSVIDRARSFPRNIEVSALQTFEVDSVPGPAGNPPNRSLNSITMLMNYSMVLLPDKPMMARLCDDRVGYFNLSFEDYDEDRVPGPRRCFIQRYRLEPKDPTAAVSDPSKPIVWYIDPATPAKWVPWLIKGVEMWEPVFRAAGFSNAITARLPEASDSDFDLDDARLSTIRWLPSTIENAYGPRLSDPRSGEILNANIGFYHNVASLVEAWYWTQAGAADARARQLPLPDSLMGLMLAYVATHEVGHSLGLRHNMVASTYYPVDSLRSRSFTCRMKGTSPSIMDYARYNYVAQPGDSACLMQGIGPYDDFAINWGYRRIAAAPSPDAERPVLDSLARLQDANPYFRWIGDGEPVDPRIITEALGDDPVKASGYGVRNIKRLVPMLIPATTTARLDNYDRLDDMYGELINQWAREMNHVAVVVGGVYQFTKYAGQSGTVYQPVPRAKQAEAVQFLNENVFTTPSFFFDPEILRRIEPTGFVERVRARQTAVLTMLFQDARLSRLAEQQATQPSPYTIPALFGDVRRGVFAEFGGGSVRVDGYRRNLQRAFVDQMERLINTPLVTPPSPGFTPFPGFTPPPPRPADARAQARLELVDLQGTLRTALSRAGDRATRAHIVDLQARIEQILNPRA
ncbi:MAG: zinc-dependent metalloprotease [Gemmatimonadetes bacterium]|nr:MAG: zinc-dependent metalloprotease [Gemmatimonadota bacterium]